MFMKRRPAAAMALLGAGLAVIPLAAQQGRDGRAPVAVNANAADARGETWMDRNPVPQTPSNQFDAYMLPGGEGFQKLMEEFRNNLDIEPPELQKLVERAKEPDERERARLAALPEYARGQAAAARMAAGRDAAQLRAAWESARGYKNNARALEQIAELAVLTALRLDKEPSVRKPMYTFGQRDQGYRDISGEILERPTSVVRGGVETLLYQQASRDGARGFNVGQIYDFNSMRADIQSRRATSRALNALHDFAESGGTIHIYFNAPGKAGRAVYSLQARPGGEAYSGRQAYGKAATALLDFETSSAGKLRRAATPTQLHDYLLSEVFGNEILEIEQARASLVANAGASPVQPAAVEAEAVPAGASAPVPEPVAAPPTAPAKVEEKPAEEKKKSFADRLREAQEALKKLQQGGGRR